MIAQGPGWVDSHLHLQDEAFDPDREETLLRARAAGVTRLWCNGASEADWAAVERLWIQYPDIIVPFFGLHPWYAGGRSAGWEDALAQRLQRIPAGVGEIGLDRWIEPRDERGQEEVFRCQLALARRLQRPVTVHCLKAFDWLKKILWAEPPLTAGMLLHAYGGPAELVSPLADRGAYFSFAGSVLRENRQRSREVLRAIPPDRLLLETDAPDIPPPSRYRIPGTLTVGGKVRNEPANLPGMARAIAEVLGLEAAVLEQRVFDNARRFWDGRLAPAPTSPSRPRPGPAAWGDSGEKP